MKDDDGDDLPTVDVGDVPEAAFDNVDVVDADSMTIDDVTKPAESLVRSFENDLGEAIASAMWHTIIDDAGTEAFVDGFDTTHLRGAVQELRSNGFASRALSSADVYDSEGDVRDGAAFFAGDDAADAWQEHVDDMVPDNVAAFDGLSQFDGYLVERAPAMPTNLIVFVDVEAIARVPAEGRNVAVGLDSTPSVSSPIVVRDPGGVAVVNIAQD